MYKKIISKTNLTPSQVAVLEFLYLNPKEKASEIAKKIKKSRAIIYKDLLELEKLGLIEKDKKNNKIRLFKATHPTNLKLLMENREKKLKQDKQLFQNSLPDLISEFNLNYNKPGIKFYEGVSGVEKILNDTLETKGVILTYVDIEAVEKFIPKINQRYVINRKKKKIKKRGILIDTPFARNFLKNYHSEITESRFIPDKFFPFGSILQIYNNKISYVSLSKNNIIGLIIEDKNINLMHRSLFEFTWLHATPQ